MTETNGALLPQRRTTDLANRSDAATRQLRSAARQIRSWTGEPQVRKWLPMTGGLAAAALALFAALSFSAPGRQTIFPGLGDADKAHIVESLAAGGFDVAVDPETGAVQVPKRDVHRARMALAAAGLPEGTASGYKVLDDMPFGTSRAVEQARLRQSQETELANSIAEVSGVESARVNIAVSEPSAFVRERHDATASVFVRLRPGRALDDGQVMSIVHLVSASVSGLAAGNVAVVDQRGTLLSARVDGAFGETGRQLAYRRKLEQQWRDRLTGILIPLFGNDNFTAEVALDLDFTASESTREVFDKEGAVLRSEQASVRQSDAMPGAAGIPGTLSNVPPPDARLEAADNADQPVGAKTDTSRDRDENYVRNFEVGKEVSVSRRAFGDVRRASIAVVIRETGGKLPAARLAEIESLIAGAVGIDAARGDKVVVRSQPFAALPSATDTPLYEQPAVQAWGSRAVALLLGIAAIIFIGRPLARMARGNPAPEAAGDDVSGTVPIDLAADANDFETRLQLLRQLVASDVDRASSAVSGLMTAEPAGEARHG